MGTIKDVPRGDWSTRTHFEGAKEGFMTTPLMQPTQNLRKEMQGNTKISVTRIMLMTDFSKVSEQALEYASAVARRYDARIYLTHIISPDSYQLAEPSLAEATYQNLRQAAEQSIADILVSGKLRGIPHEVLLYEGSLWPTVESLIKEYGIDLVVIGTHGRGQFKKMILGSVAEEVFRQAGCPVLTVGPRNEARVPYEVELQNILFATDYGPGAERAAQYAFSLAQEHGARLTLLHVVEEIGLHTEEQIEQVRKVNIQKMRRFMPQEIENWCNVTFRVAFGTVIEEILEEARDTRADLIIMGTKARKTFAGHAPMTIAYNIAAKAKCPVLTVRG